MRHEATHPGVHGRARGFFAQRVALALLVCGMATLSCQSEPSGTPMDDTELKKLLRPAEPITDEWLVRGHDNKGYYMAVLRDLPPSGYEDRYLAEIEERGVSLDVEATSPHAGPQRVTGYSIRIVQEATLSPYTIRFKVASEHQRDLEDLALPRFDAHPLTISGRELTLRFGPELFGPWREAVVVPEEHTTRLPFPFPLPPTGVVVGFQEQRERTFIDGRVQRPQSPTAFVISIVTRIGPSDVLAFYRSRLGSSSKVLSNEPGHLVLEFASDLPTWSPKNLRFLTVDEDVFLFAADGVFVLDARHAGFRTSGARPGYFQPMSLRHVPPDAFRYRIRLALSGAGDQPGE